jgi:hypothetical protein
MIVLNENKGAKMAIVFYSIDPWTESSDVDDFW